MELSDRIRTVREEKRIKLIEMATALGVDVSNYAKIEKKGKKLTLDRIEEIASALDIPVMELLGYEHGNTSQLQQQVLDLKTENESLKAKLKKEKAEKIVFRDTLQMITNLFNGLFSRGKGPSTWESINTMSEEEFKEMRDIPMSVNVDSLLKNEADDEEQD